jgi:hypothetical protein
MSAVPLDPSADRARRAWLPCPHCDHGTACTECAAGRNCDTHWQYLLGNTGAVLHLQCPTCAHLWDLDTRPGARGEQRPAA